jgi:hypothetical protein
MTTAADFISAAYNRSSANDPGKLAQDAELLAHLNRVYQRLWALWSRARPDEAGSVATVTLAGVPPFSVLPTGEVDIIQVTNALLQPVHVIPSNELTRQWHVAPCVYRLGVNVVSRNLASDPLAGDVLTLNLLDAPLALTTTSTLIDPRFPIRHHQLPIDSLAVYLSVKDAGRDQGDRTALLGELKIAGACFVAEYDLPPSAIEWIHAPVDRSEIPA